MLEYIKKNVDKQTVDKINQLLKTSEGQRLLSQIQHMDKQQLLAALKGKDLSKINFDALNASLQHADLKEILKKLNGGGF